jgi:hypothetical protein
MKIWINRAGQNLGQFTLEEVQRGLEQGQFIATDLAWQEGMDTWKPLSEFPGITIPSAPAEPVAAAPTEVVPVSNQLYTGPAATGIAPTWERRPEVKFFPALFSTFREVLFEPGPTFERLPRNGRLMNATVFYATISGFYLLLNLLFEAAILPISLSSKEFQQNEIPVWAWFVGLPIVFVLAWLLTVGMNFVAAGIYHLCLMMVGGARNGYETTYKVVSYSNCAVLFSLVPCLGSLATLGFFFTCSIIGLARAHRTEGWKAAVAMLLPAAICCVLVVAVYGAMIAGVMQMIQANQNQ